jgi:acyl-CoA synthetase (AMP-forming)/AMP-acid ligase II/acyl carrier protein
MTEATTDEFTERLRAIAARQPTAPALTAPGRPAMSFGELAACSDALAAQLAGWGIARGDIVAWPTVGRVESLAALAMMPAGSTLAPLAPGLTAEACEALLRRLRPRAVAVPEGGGDAIVEAARRLGLAEIRITPDTKGSTGAFGLALAQPATADPADARRLPQAAFVSATSGTTGRAKLVPHGRRQLVVGTDFLRERLVLGPHDVSGHLTPLHLANGIRTGLLMSLFNGGAVNCLPEADLDALLAAIGRGEVTYASLSFTLLREVLRRCDAGLRVRTGRLRFLRTASGRLDDGEIVRLEAALGIPLVTGLASTETYTIAHQALPPARRSLGSVGTPVGCEIRLVDGNGRVVTDGESGEIEVRGPQVFDSYLDDSPQDAPAFVDGWYRMGDLGRFDAAGELHVVGRVKDVINRGGEKISPAEVDAALRAVPGIADAAAFGIAHPTLGEEIVAAVVRAPDSHVEAEQVIAAVRDRLGPQRAPRRLWFVDELPRTEAGKVRRSELPAWVGYDAAKAAAVDATAEQDLPATARTLAGLWATVLRLPSVPADADFFMLGGDSLRGMQLIGEVRKAFGVELPLRSLFADAATVARMARYIDALCAQAASPTSPPPIARRARGGTARAAKPAP